MAPMNRAGFLRRAALGLGALWLPGVRLPPRAAESLQEGAEEVSVGFSPYAILFASGGFCAPVVPYYNLQVFDLKGDKISGLLPSFQADRGGITYRRSLNAPGEIMFPADWLAE